MRLIFEVGGVHTLLPGPPLTSASPTTVSPPPVGMSLKSGLSLIRDPNYLIKKTSGVYF
jgi:hypothetical protein